MTRPLLRLRGVELTFGVEAPVHALAGVDLDVAAGDYVAVTGRSGSGKSSLLNVLGLLERPTAGTYEVEGIEISSLKPSQIDRLRAKTFGLVFQSFHLVDYLSVAENVGLGLTYSGLAPALQRRRIDVVIEQVGIGHRSGARTATLSGGERQRVAIARTLAREPEVLLADEPTGNLDEANSAAVLDLFETIHTAGVTVIVVTHDEETAHRARRRVLVRDGRIAG